MGRTSLSVPVAASGCAKRQDHERLLRRVFHLLVRQTSGYHCPVKDYQPRQSFDATYAEQDPQRSDERQAVEFLADFTGSGPVLELAIGTGRIALPLAARGHRVDGIDISPEMVARLRAKPGGDRIAVTIGDFADVAVRNRYSLIYVVWNSFFNLLTQEAQLRCFENVARSLLPHGVFVIEAFVPAFLYELDNRQYVRAESVETEQVALDVLRHDPSTQTIEESHVFVSESGFRLNPVVQRYAWPSELDLMARCTALVLSERFGSWERTAFTGNSELHVSVYRPSTAASS